MDNTDKITIVGLGYVGLPLAIEFGKYFDTTGYDVNSKRISELKKNIDTTLEINEKEFNDSKNIFFTDSLEQCSQSNIYIITVPTPVDKHNRPDLTPLHKSSESIGSILKKGDIVIYESTVYPGATEEYCVPILETVSGLKFNEDFFCGYSPERINPGDKKYRLTNITKVVSGSNETTLNKVNLLYSKIIEAGTHKASSIRVAEAAKVIENTQRDVNIALINELSVLFDKLGISTKDVLEAASTKWNFLNFQPGLVGGHCIGVDPYYLTHKAMEIGHNPEIILAGRRINDQMGAYVIDRVCKLMIKKGIKISNSKFLIMGLTFKENCPDIRNTKVTDIYFGLKEFSKNIDVYDPWVTSTEIEDSYNIAMKKELSPNTYDAIIIAVSHKQFKKMGLTKIKQLGKKKHVVFDIKSIFSSNSTDGSL